MCNRRSSRSIQAPRKQPPNSAGTPKRGRISDRVKEKRSKSDAKTLYLATLSADHIYPNSKKKFQVLNMFKENGTTSAKLKRALPGICPHLEDVQKGHFR